MFSKYIKQLLKNIPKPNIPYQLDVAFEGGSFNGLYGIGVLMFIKEMEKQGYLQINRLSGASIGSWACLKYITNKLSDTTKYYSIIKKSIRDNFSIHIIKKIIEKDLNNMSEETFEKIKKNKIYITYHDINLKKKIIKSEYSSKEELKTVILKSCHFPWIIDGNCVYKDNDHCFLDGAIPYIFSEREQTANGRILYITISKLSQLKHCFFLKNENPVYGRISEGILDAYKFFGNNSPTRFCSYVNQWHITDFMFLRFKNLFFIFVCYFIDIGLKVGKKIKPLLDKNGLYNEIFPIFQEMYRDILLYSCF